MGAVFAIPYALMTDWFDGPAGLQAAGFRLLALTPDRATAPIGAAMAVAGHRTALLLGTEGDGVSSAGCTRPIRPSVSRCIRAPWPAGSTRSMWSPPPRLHATCSWVQTRLVRASLPCFRNDLTCHTALRLFSWPEW